MPTTVIHCNAYTCRYIAKVGDLCCAEAIDVKGTVCMSFRRESKGEHTMRPGCHRESGKWVADHFGVLK